MCSLGDDNIEENTNKYMKSYESSNLNNAVCKKCRILKTSIVLRAKDAYCRDCFLSATIHKFKGYLGKHRLIRKDEKVMVLYKPGHSITSLLHFLRTGLDLGAHKKLRFIPIVLYIENRADLTVEERKKCIRSIQEDVTQYKFPLYFCSLFRSVNSNEKHTQLIKENINNVTVSSSDKELLDKIIKNKNASISEDHLSVLERNLILNCAEELNCKWIFTTELGIDLASKLLTNISLGRGDQLPLDVGLMDNRIPSTNILRPLRMFDMKELAFYNLFNKLEPLVLPPQKGASQETVHNLLKTFVEDLQINYPATIATIVRTGEKLSLDSNNLKMERCSLCNGPIRKMCDEITSEESTDFSHFASTQKANCDETNGNLFDRSKVHKLCFGCRKI